MKKIVFFALSICCLGFCEEAKWEVLSVSELSEEHEERLQRGELVLEIPAQMHLPLYAFLQGKCFSLQEKEEDAPLADIVVHQTLYLRMVSQDEFPLISTDLIEWKPALAFFTGSIQVGVRTTKELGPHLILGGELNQRP